MHSVLVRFASAIAMSVFLVTIPIAHSTGATRSQSAETEVDLANGHNWSVYGGGSDAQLGARVARAGDINQDGFDDVIICAWNYSNGQTSEGQARIYLGSASSLDTTPFWMVESNTANAQLGSAVGSAGDVNNDGYDDVFGGVWGHGNGQPAEGASLSTMARRPG